MIEVEIKLPIGSPEMAEQALLLMGFEEDTLLQETDIYFTSESRDIRKRGEALRVREVKDLNNGTTKAVMTFKGPKLDEVSMTREELETEIASLDTGKRLFEAIGFRPVQPLVKTRKVLRKGNMTACLDNVCDLGTFLELEYLAESEAERVPALHEMEHLLQELGCNMTDTTRTSYLSMLQEQGKISF